MHTHDESQSSLVLRFFDSFLQERNIKWVLTTGVIILLGSSLMMVSSQWREIADIWKFCIFLGYTYGFAAAGAVAYSKLGLRKTGQFLRALTVLIIPLTFYVWNWLVTGAARTPAAVALALLAVSMALAVFASDRIFRHFLRGRQLTFQAAYLLLCFAAVLCPLLSSLADPLVWLWTLLLWTVTSAGIVKVNRHAFWMAEENRAPRIYGFFPIALLGAQFLTLFFTYCAAQMSLAWIGCGTVLTAIPVLLTGDAVARVHMQRHGDFVRPLPWSIIGPLAAGLLLTVGGVCLSFSDLASGVNPLAVAPTTLLATVLFAVVAARTQRRPLVWIGLACLVAAYNFCPAFFSEFARQIAGVSAAAVGEQRLPFAFYGLTYLPLIGGLTFAATRLRQRGNDLFAKPIAQFSAALPLLLLAISLGNAKALFPVASAMTLLLTIQAFCFRDRRLIVAAIGGLLTAAVGAPLFADQVMQLTLPPDAELYSLSAVAVALSAGGLLCDRRLVRLSWPEQLRMGEGNLPRFDEHLLKLSGLGTAVTLAASSLTASLAPVTSASHWPLTAALIGLLLAHSLYWLRPSVSGLTLLLAQVAAYAWAFQQGVSVEVLLSVGVLQLSAQWSLQYLFRLRETWRISRAFAGSNYWLSLSGMTTLTLAVCWPAGIFELTLADRTAWQPFWLVCYLAAAVWSFDAARTTRQPFFGVLGAASGLLLAALAAFRLTGELSWALIGCVLAAMLAAPLISGLRKFQRHLAAEPSGALQVDAIAAVTTPLETVALSTLTVAAVCSLLLFEPALQTAGWLGAAGLITFSLLQRRRLLLTLALVLSSWQALQLVAAWAAPEPPWSWFDLLTTQAIPSYLPTAFAAALLSLFWQPAAGGERNELRTIRRTQQGLLLTAASLGVSLAGCLALFDSRWHPGLLDGALAAGVFAVLAGTALREAIQRQAIELVWLFQIVVAAGVAHLACLDMFSLIGPWTAPGVLAAAVLLEVLARGLEGTRLSIVSEPFRRSADILPLAAVVLTLGRHAWGGQLWMGVNSLYLLTAAALYFWKALERRQVSSGLLAGGVANLALMLLWRELQWTDPQLYLIPIGVSLLGLVEVLKREIPEAARNPLRYAGALIILVSPTFQIISGSWLHLFLLMAISVAVLLAAIGLRVRALVYTGTAFLVADFMAILVRGCVDNPARLWVAGIALGIGVIALGAIAENSRERVLQRIRRVSSELTTWS